MGNITKLMKIFFDCECDAFGTIKKIGKPKLSEQIIETSKLHELIINSFSSISRGEMYFLTHVMKAKKIIAPTDTDKNFAIDWKCLNQFKEKYPVYRK